MNDKRKRKWDQPAAAAPPGQATGSIPAGGGLPPDLLAQAQAAAIAAAQKLTAGNPAAAAQAAALARASAANAVAQALHSQPGAAPAPAPYPGAHLAPQAQGYPLTHTTQDQCQARCQVSIQACQVSTRACQVSHSSCRQVTPMLPLLQQHSRQLLHKLPQLLPLPPRPRPPHAARVQTSAPRWSSMMRRALHALL
ncbi:hypothetical protein COO60DRAFT_1108204 [Scenedesmus sp. NREL 46B-D3]|nr:hypothetical protein COO60DRAFT_1108204 [Scenedesmus sp. NREL 46B-D3]